MLTDGGGWLRRKDGSQDFYRNWTEYAAGFGDMNGEFWLGNRNLHALTSAQQYEARIDLRDSGESRFAKFATFSVGSEAEGFRLSIGGYSGNAGDSMARHNGQQFSTRGADNDIHLSINCADLYKGGWWYFNCHSANLNGLYLNGPFVGDSRGVVWSSWKDYRYSLQFTEMKMRPL
ncbi:hypothetical protein CAPTEDRAFT_197507 [Capitella teleta]|uniref:Fibrinogen C-terminal domain-containing protein n=1 Tax=Capitella teleta TaxID=283909 RepID=R7TLN3_CAPTE|nr:hypothetical protein CAPTEDRAFT_197507 [Capitella teleta]|eukprot:ELT94412.1 hypothetical protein CAPTEDRAFT_197507 [Capitella teleta]